jgi:GTP-binding protein
MAFIDDLTFHIKAGNGGNGVVRWRHERGKEFSGAAGGNGGKGGDVYIKGIRDLGVLASYRNIKEFEAGKGEDGMRNSMHGADGKDLTINLPIGSVITDLRTSRVYYLNTESETIKILNGGRGGLGNEHFKASTNVTPKQSTLGIAGEEADFHISLELVADAGLIGLPNAGKSSLLNAITNAKAQVGSYAFTTLEPNLGALKGGYVVADIPGLIEGASEGKGLGYKFLRHIKRTKRLFHLISLEEKAIVSVYKTIRKELESYGHGLEDKEETIILTKTDTVDKKVIQKAISSLKKYNKDILTVTVLDDKDIKDLTDKITKRLSK